MRISAITEAIRAITVTVTNGQYKAGVTLGAAAWAGGRAEAAAERLTGRTGAVVGAVVGALDGPWPASTAKMTAPPMAPMRRSRPFTIVAPMGSPDMSGPFSPAIRPERDVSP